MPVAPARTPRSLGEQRSDHHAALGLLALAVGLDPGPVLEMGVDDAALLSAHRLELDRAPGALHSLGGAIRLAMKDLLPLLAIPGGVDDHPLPLPAAAERGPVAEELQGIDRLAPAADQKPEVVALDPDGDLLVLLL